MRDRARAQRADGQQPTRPAAPSGWERGQRHLNDSFDDFCRYRVILASRLRLVRQAIHATLGEPTTNAGHVLLRHGNAPCDVGA
jgi:hypothetical protein